MDGANTIITPDINFPKGGGAIQGFGEALSGGGILGAASLSIPLPVSPARAFTPALSLNYSSTAGNGPFGMGFFISLPAISRRLAEGTPTYTDQDEFLGLSREILIPDGTDQRQYKNVTYQVTRFYPRIEENFDRYEFWQDKSNKKDFWWVYQADGSQHIFGKTDKARLSDPKEVQKTFRWLVEESLSVRGEHVMYDYKAEDDEGIPTSNVLEKAHAHTNRYIKGIHYGNLKAADEFYCLNNKKATDIDWLFQLIIDYGEHVAAESGGIPSFTKVKEWLLRLDSFSDYSAGFEVRTHRLGRRALMFHNFTELGAEPTLVAGLEFIYDESPIVTCLEAVYSIAYREEGNKLVPSVLAPPLEFKYQKFAIEEGKFTQFKPFVDLPGLNDGRYYQLVDLYGEGIPGILYRDGVNFLYHAPERGTDGGDTVRYDDWQPLPSIPTGGIGPRPLHALMDITGDGYLDWVVAIPGMAGFFSLGADQHWRNFIPFSAFPTEFNHPSAQLANIMGAGLADLILIGPKSVRLYANKREAGFAAPVDVDYAKNDAVLPASVPSDNEVIAFSDILGSGQQHLVRIRYNEVTCWPNLGRGEFASPIQFAHLPFDSETFNAKHVFLADIDGSGATDLLYVLPDRIKIFLNQSGNGFAAPYELPFPSSVRYDNLAQVSFADVLGNGSASLVVTLTHPEPEHWIVDFTAGKKPYLLEQTNNNRGLNSAIVYRSSAQEWLDEKKERAGVCHLPFPVHVVSHVINYDEITGNLFQQRFVYRQGYYDGIAREFRGFAYVAHYDSENFSQPEPAVPPKTDGKVEGTFYSPDVGHAGEINFSPPLLTKVWYHTGAIDSGTDKRDYYAEDKQAIVLGNPLWFDKSGNSLTTINEDGLREFQRSLRGRVLRQEVFSFENNQQAKHPYTVEAFRYQARIQEDKGTKKYPSLFPALLEQVAYNYDQRADDPRCDHLINIHYDKYGTTTESIAINYPRRGALKPDDPYYDEEQFVLRVLHTVLNVIHLDAKESWRLALPYESRSEMTFFPVPTPGTWTGALSYEKFTGAGKLLGELGVGEVIAWKQYEYWSPKEKKILPFGKATVEGLLGQAFAAEIKRKDLQTIFAEIPSITDKAALEKRLILEKGRYSAHRSTETQFPEFYWIPSSKPIYNDLDHFFRVDGQKDPFDSETHYDYDRYSYAIKKVTDALGYETNVVYDYRVLQVYQIKDPNERVQQVGYDAFARLYATTLQGFEDGKKAGFDLLDAYKVTNMTLEEAIDKPEKFVQNAAGAYFYDSLSWMGEVTETFLKETLKVAADPKKLIVALQNAGFMSKAGYLTAKARWNPHAALPADVDPKKDILALLVKTVPRVPCHSATFVADAYTYPADIAVKKQIRISISYSDGFSRILQVKQLVPAGDSYIAKDAILVIEANKPVERKAEQRWAVSGRVEYNNKGLPVRKYQAYFINTHLYVHDASLRYYAYYDSVFYDALGRELKIVNAAGFFQRYTYHPWYLSHEDENDTWAEVLEKGSS